MNYYETVLVLKERFENRNKIHQSLEKLIRDCFFIESSKVLRHTDCAPRYRFVVQPHPDGVICIVRSRLPLGLPGEQEKSFSHKDGEDFEFKSLMCLNTKQSSKLVFNSKSLDAMIDRRLSQFGIEQAGVYIDEAERYPISKKGHKFFLMAGWVSINVTATAQQAYELMVEGLGIKGVYGFGLVIPESS